MDVNDSFATSEDIIKGYSEKRPSVTEADTKDLLRIMVKYMKQKLKSDEFYALETKIGTFYREFDSEAFINCKKKRTKKEEIEEKLLLNSIFKLKVLREYNYNEFELLKENTNNRPIKN